MLFFKGSALGIKLLTSLVSHNDLHYFQIDSKLNRLNSKHLTLILGLVEALCDKSEEEK